jgi:Ran GTPase-activating protein (RanGAP) involved in mRNA processing and transport
VSLLKSKKSITDLHLDNNQTGDEGVEQLANALSHPEANLQRLYLDHNKGITDQAANYLIEMLKTNRSLNTLWLGDCSFTPNKRKKLVEASESREGFYLNIERY